MNNPIIEVTTLHQKRYGTSPKFVVETNFVGNKTNLPINTVTFQGSFQNGTEFKLTGEIGENKQVVKERLATIILEQLNSPA
jgi:hypothetical protein